MKPTHVQVTLVNKDQNSRFYDEREEVDSDCSMGELYRIYRDEYGRCVSKVYMDYKDGSVKAIGWVFESRQKYTDCDDTYLREAWVVPVCEVEEARPARFKSVGL